MQKKIFSFVISLTFILSCFTPLRAFAATEQTLAAFEYTAPTGAAAGDDLANGDKTNGYSATEGIMQSSAKLFASVDGTDPRKLEWSDTGYTYKASAAAMVPLMTAGKNNLWGESPYFEVKCSTLGYENIKFSAKISGSKKGPANYKLQYSTDNANYIDVVSDPAITQNKNSQNNLFDKVSIPSASDKATVYFRMIAANTKTIEGNDFYSTKSGEAAINDIFIYGTSKSAAIPKLAAPTANIASGSEIYGNSAISISCSTSQTAQIYYTVNDGAVTEYTGGFMPFKNISDSTIVIKIWAKLDGYTDSDTDTKALRVKASDQNAWNFDTDRINPDNDGYWLITASTKGYTNIKFSADHLSTPKGPRDYAVSISTDGVNYTPLANSSVHVTDSLSSTYTNISLPDELSNKDKIYIKIKIDGGETLSGLELSSTDPTENVYGNGNTDINNIEICGTKIENKLGIEGNPQTIEKGVTYYINHVSATANPTAILADHNSSGEMIMFKQHANKIEIPSDSDVTDIKIMLWESLGNLTPIVQSITKKFQ